MPWAAGYNGVLTRILGTLAEALDREDGANDGKPVDQMDGYRLVMNRPDAGWANFDRIRDVALGGSQPKLDALEPYLVLHAWVDRKVIRPNAATAMAGISYPTWADIRLAHESHPGVPVPDFERLPVQPGGRIVGRAPVSLAWARTRRPALIALLSGLKGLYLDESTAQNAYDSAGFGSSGTDAIGTLRAVEIENAWSQADACHVATEALISWTTEIATWEAWNAFCDTLAFTGTPEEVEARRDLLKANFNPNSDLNKFNPDASLARRVDKSDLLVYSTEFSLLSLGCGRVHSVGRVLDARGRLLASAQAGADIQGDGVFRITTQREFVAGDLGQLDLAGDEAAPRGYGDVPYVTPAQGNLMAFGHKLFGGSGMSLQSLPEPHTAPPASYDGQLRLATLETADGQDGPTMMFLARFDDGFAADHSGGAGTLALAAPYDSDQPLASASLWDASRPNTLHTDGLYIERGRQPGYACMGNMAAQRGTISFWAKPSYDGQRQNVDQGGWSGGHKVRRHLYWNATRTDGVTPPNEKTAALAFVNATSSQFGATVCGPVAFGGILETRLTSSDDLGFGWIETSVATPQRTDPPHRWRLLTMFWDAAESTASYALNVAVDRGLRAADRGDWWYGLTLLSGDIDFRMPDGYTMTSGLLPPAVFYLGRRGNDHQNGHPIANYGAPDATFDEFAIYDFGAVNATAWAAAVTMTQNRFADGRFIKASAYAGLGAGGNEAPEYHSAPVDLGRARLKRLAWTAVVPRGLRAPLRQGGQAGVDGDDGPDGRILLELADPSGQAYALDARGRPMDRIFTRSGGEAVGRWVEAPFLFHAAFQPNLEDPDDTPILDPLALDDVTLTYERPGGPRLLQWETGR